MMLYVRLFLTLVFLVAGWSAYNRWSALEVFAQNPSLEGVLQSIERDPSGPEYHFLAGLLYRDQIDHLDTAKALHHLDRALELNPYSWRYWLEMGRTIELEEPSEAEVAYQQALELNPNAAPYHWRVANFYIRREAFQDSIPHLLTAVSLNESYQPAALRLLWRMGLGLRDIEEIWPNDRKARLQLISFLVQQAGQTPSRELAESIERQWDHLLDDPVRLEISDARRYLRHLFDSGEFLKLRERWIELMSLKGFDCSDYREYENLVWNGDFETPVQRGILDWQLIPGRGYELEVQEGHGYQNNRGLVLTFNGIENLNFAGVRQTVILEPGQDYHYSFFARSEELSTEQGLFLEIVDGATHKPIQHSPQILGTTDWKLYTGSFSTSRDTGYVTIRLRRRPSRRIDNQLQGTAYLDLISIKTSLGAGNEKVSSLQR